MEDRKTHLIHSFSHRKGEEIQMALTEYKGRQYIDLRVWFQSKNAQAMRPTRKGLNFSFEKLSEFQRGVNRLLKAAEGYQKKETSQQALV